MLLSTLLNIQLQAQRQAQNKQQKSMIVIDGGSNAELKVI